MQPNPTAVSASSPAASPSGAQPQQQQITQPPAAATKVDYTQEVRFALVMYGGSSLAIYMNGVAQEFLRMVRATAPACDENGHPLSHAHLADARLKGSEKVYRQLGQMLVRGEPVEPGAVKPGAPIRTRFMIDILSGTSAGGINAVFLAKALANDQSMNQLRAMWVAEGDITKLLNDKESDEGIDLGQQTPPRSLLNSRRMYYKLLNALYEMDCPPSSSPPPGGQTAAEVKRTVSPYADEIDLFTTATDIWGQVVNIRLADGVARERRHLNKFHFRYRSKRASESAQNDFGLANNPFLAFAARCTSAHQSSFEPMNLANIDEALEKHKGYKDRPTLRADNDQWRSFYETYLRQPRTLNAKDDPKLREHLAEKFKTRPFSDGGALDNSPFSFAIDQLSLRYSELPVERKLMYVEPVPEHPEETTDPTRPPDAIQNAWLALSVLPRYQFIREDLERLLERNRLIERVNRIIEGIERDEMIRLRKERRSSESEAVKEPGWESFCNTDISGMIEKMGSAQGGYHRLRVAETTDEMEKIISQAAGFDPDTAESQAVRHLVRTWRIQNFDAYRKTKRDTPPAAGQSSAAANNTGNSNNPALTASNRGATEFKETENCFLYKYDLKWRRRRLKFVLKKIDEISCFDDNLEVLLGISERATVEEESRDAMAASLRLFLDRKIAAEKKVEVEDEFRKALQSFKGELNRVLREMVSATHTLLPRSGSSETDDPRCESDQQLEDLFAGLKNINRDELKNIAEGPTDDARTDRAKALLQTNKSGFDEFLLGLNSKFNDILYKAAVQVEGKDQISVGKIGSSLFRAGDLKDRGELVGKLRDARDPLSQYLRGKLSQETQQELGEYIDSSLPSDLLQSALVKMLNQQLKSPYLYDQERFEQITLPKKIDKLIKQNPQGESLIQLNRLLLEEAYPIRGILEETAPSSFSSPPTPEFIAARRALRYYYDNFDRYDMISYPILYATKVGEEIDVIDVYRVSPEDADQLIPDEQLRRRKLAGTSLGNFGAFFDEKFRLNDILWGRLDCAERIITALLPMSLKEEKRRLIREAQQAIIAEEFASADQAGISALLSTLMLQDEAPEQRDKLIVELDSSLKSAAAKNGNLAGDDSAEMKELQKFIKFSLSPKPKDPLRYFVETYNFDYSLNPQTMVKFAGRASKVVGKMLEGIAETNRIGKSRVVWITRLAQLFWGLVEVAVPGSIGNLVWRHWLKLLYLFEFLLILFGTIFVSPTVQKLGILTFAITVGFQVTASILGDLMRGKSTRLKWLASLAIALLCVAAATGLIFFASFLFSDSAWDMIMKWRKYYAAPNLTPVERLWRAWPLLIINLLFLFFALRDKLQAPPRAVTKPSSLEAVARVRLASKLREIRLQSECDPQQMAARLNGVKPLLSADAIFAYESCAEQPSPEVLSRYASIANVPLLDLLDTACDLPARQ